jgi:signal peptidase I
MRVPVPNSGSMEPAFYRGDLLFLTNPRNEPYAVGDITVYKVRTHDYYSTYIMC